MSRVASRVSQAALPGAVGITAALDAVAEAYHNPAAVWWRPLHLPPACRLPYLSGVQDHLGTGPLRRYTNG